jgi:NAD(P)-dependent dehydrogenase (short-subunit alcohol dehydrogenase family)
MTGKKIAIITGGSRGVGRSAALELAGRDVGVILTYNSHPEDAEAVVAEIAQAGHKAVALQLDVTQVKTFDDFVSRVSQTLENEWQQKTFDYLINNAGNAQRTPIAKTTEEEFDRLTNEHFKGPFFLTQKLIEIMADGGHVLNISSALTRFAGNYGVATYASLKGAMEVMTNYIAREYEGRKIRANIVAPGALDTQFGGGRTDEMRKMIGDHTLNGRIGTADDIGKIIAAVLSNDFYWVNGQRIEANGGVKL